MDLGTVYLICAAVGGVVLAIRLILTFAGLDHGDVPGDVDLHVDVAGMAGIEAGTHGGGYNLLSVQSIASFFTMFGLVGIGLLKMRATDVVSLLGALAAGAFTAWCTAMIYVYLQKLHSEGTLKLSNAIGQTGTVYLKIPEKGSGVVNVAVQGAMRSCDAISQQGTLIPTGTIVQVTGVTAGKILIVSELPANTSHSQ